MSAGPCHAPPSKACSNISWMRATATRDCVSVGIKEVSSFKKQFRVSSFKFRVLLQKPLRSFASSACPGMPWAVYAFSCLKLETRNLKLFWLQRQTFADFLGQLFMHPAGALFGSPDQHDRHWRCHGHNDPHQAGEQKSSQGNHFQDYGVARRVMAHQAEGNQEDYGGNGGDGDEPKIDHAMQQAFGAAVLALRQMLFVVAAHLRDDAADVVTPPCQNASDDPICALMFGHCC